MLHIAMAGSHGHPQRREQVLAAALTVFAASGYRRTSMEAVAQAADISRPGLYFLFSNKEELFRETMRQALDEALRDAREALAADGNLNARVVAALDAQLGRYVGTHLNAGIEDLLDNSVTRLRGMYDDYRSAFVDVLSEAIAAAPDPPTGAASPRQIAEVLQAAGESWKHRLTDRPEFVAKLAMAADVALR